MSFFRLRISVLVAAILAIALSCFNRTDVRAEKEFTVAEFATLYFATPVTSFRDLKGSAYLGVPSIPQYGYSGYITFACDSKPVLRDAALYKTGGDFVGLVDTFLALFEAEATPLLHSKDTECLRLIEGGRYGVGRYFMHNKRTNQYFFRRGGNDCYPG